MRERLAVALFRVVVLLHAALVLAQPVLAGAILEASATARAVHETVGDTLVVVAMVQLPVAVLAWRPGRMPAWLPVLAALQLAAEITQLLMGYDAVLSVHVPLGVTIVATAAVLAVWSLRRRRSRGNLPEVGRPAPAPDRDRTRL